MRMVQYARLIRIVIKVNEDEMYPGQVGIHIYNLTKYTRSQREHLYQPDALRISGPAS
ncbi:hypothetical protein ACNKHO_25580 [Shigella flexneri]